MEAFRAASTETLKTFLTRMRTAVEALPERDLWWRPHEASTSVGNLLLHLSGNVRQWISGGLGGAADARDRASEFAARDGATRAGLLARLEGVVEEACRVIDGLDDAALQRPVTIQGFATTGLRAVYHVVEHFAWHTGQVVWIAKARAGADHGIAFYDDDALNRARNP